MSISTWIIKKINQEKKVRNINYDEDDFIKYSAKNLLTSELIRLIIYTMHKIIIYWKIILII